MYPKITRVRIRMTRKKHILLLLLALPLLIASCSSDEEVVTDNYCYISGFQLGTVTRSVTVTSYDGKDSTYRYTFSGAAFPMKINQKTLTIENTDSLPINTRLSAVLATINFKGVLAYRTQEEADRNDGSAWRSYSSTDSIDFSRPLQFACLSSDGLSSRYYTVKVNVHKQDGDKMTWNEMGSSTTLAGLTDCRMASLDGKLFLAGKSAGAVKVYSRDADADEWTELSVTGADEAVPSTLMASGSSLYMSTTTGSVISSTDGAAWTACGTAKAGVKLVASSADYLYAIADSKLWSMAIAGGDWTEEKLDADGSCLPDGVVSACFKKTNGRSLNSLMLVGNSSGVDDKRNVVWAKSWGTAGAEDKAQWMYYTPNSADKYRCPNLPQLTVCAYDGGLVAFGKTSTDGRYKALSYLLYSADNGVTWKEAPEDKRVPNKISQLAATAENICGTVDGDNYLWILIDNTLWRGRTNRLGFESNK